MNETERHNNFLLIADSKGHTHCDAIYAIVNDMYEAALLELNNNLKEGSQPLIRYLLSRVKTLKDVLDLPEEGKRYRNSLEEQQ